MTVFARIVGVRSGVKSQADAAERAVSDASKAVPFVFLASDDLHGGILNSKCVKGR